VMHETLGGDAVRAALAGPIHDVPAGVVGQ
jgi:hypothetical protein